MKTYRTTILRRTKKGHTEVLHEIFINSENSKELINRNFSEKYEGFEVEIREIKTINFEVEEKKIDYEEEAKAEEEALKNKEIVLKQKGEYIEETHYQKYKVTLRSEKIKNYRDWMKKINESFDKYKELEKDFKTHICDSFFLTEISEFNYDRFGVEFTYCSLDVLWSEVFLKGKENIREEK